MFKASTPKRAGGNAPSPGGEGWGEEEGAFDYTLCSKNEMRPGPTPFRSPDQDIHQLFRHHDNLLDRFAFDIRFHFFGGFGGSFQISL